MSLNNEASWAVKHALEHNLIVEEDTAVLFQSWNQLDVHLQHLKSAFSSFDCLHSVAIKTNPNISVLKRIVDQGFGLEAASMEEVELAFRAGILPSKLVFDSPVKTRLELQRCHTEFAGIIVNANCISELARMPENPNFTLGLRINPMQSSDAPAMYDVSTDESKFGQPIEDEKEILQAILEYPITQLHVHVGSSISNMEESIAAFSKVGELISKANIQLKQNAIDRQIETFDIGGGLVPEKLKEGVPSTMEKFAKAIWKKTPMLRNVKIITEFGQWVHFHAGYAISNIEYVLTRKNKQIIFIHLGADYFMRDAYYKTRPMSVKLWRNGFFEEKEGMTTDFAGPLCFAGDYVKKNDFFPIAKDTDKVAFLGTGSNSYGLWSRHCSRKIPKILGVDYKNKHIDILSERQHINF